MVIECVEVLLCCVVVLELCWGDFIEVVVFEIGKVFVEVDVEVSEVVDFVWYYVVKVCEFDVIGGVVFVFFLVMVVILLWNFFFVIFVGGVFVVLVVGFGVVFKLVL